MKRRRKKKTSHAQACLVPFSSVSPYQHFGCKFSCVCVCVCVLFFFFFLQIIPQCRKGPKLGDLAFIYILTGLCFSCSAFFQRTESKMEFQGAKKKQSGNRSSNKILEWASHRDPCGCRAVVMSLSAHLLWLPSCLSRGPWGHDSCVRVCCRRACLWTSRR